jgi:hypothetical protein
MAERCKTERTGQLPYFASQVRCSRLAVRAFFICTVSSLAVFQHADRRLMILEVLRPGAGDRLKSIPFSTAHCWPIPPMAVQSECHLDFLSRQGRFNGTRIGLSRVSGWQDERFPVTLSIPLQ